MSDQWKDKFEEARKRHEANKNKQVVKKVDGLSRLSHHIPAAPHIPDDVFLRRGGKRTREEATWTCEICKTTVLPKQYVNGFMPGKCPCQIEQERMEEQQRQRMTLWRIQEARIAAAIAQCYNWLGEGWEDEGMAEMTFDNFDESLQPDAFFAASKFASDPYGNFIMWSDTSWGTGKSHLAAAICNHRLKEGDICNFTTAQNLFNAFGMRMDDREGYSDLVIKAGSCDLLVIDDLDKMRQSDYKLSVLFEVINKRYLRRKPTIITTNARVEVLPGDIAGISDYIGRAAASRLTSEMNGGLIVQEMNGEDYRRRKGERRW